MKKRTQLENESPKIPEKPENITNKVEIVK